jgi:glucose-1-phosphatase
MSIQFLYFDLGNVLVRFDADRMLRQIGDLVGMTAGEMKGAIYDTGLTPQYELGRLSTDQYYEAFCAAAKCRPDRQRMAAAAAEIFDLNVPVLPLVAQLRQAGYPLGILSNTCPIHWEYCVNRYRILTEGFLVHALSYRIGALKPDAAIYRAAAELAGRQPEEIFFVDDTPGHVVGARAAGFDAVPFTTAEALADELRRRGMRFNY